MGMANAGGSSMGAARAKIEFDLSDLQRASQVARQSGGATSRALEEMFRGLRNEQRLAQTQAQQALAAMRGEQAQATAAARAAASERIAQARVASSAAIEQHRRETAAFKAQLRERAAAERSQQSYSAYGLLRQGFGQVAGAVGVGISAATVVQVARTTNELAKSAAQAERVRSSFDQLAEKAGSSADEMLVAMRRASRGMVSDTNLILNANRALITGVADDAEEMAQLLEVARVRGQALGIGLDEAFTRLTQGIGKREKEILDELGIVLNLNTVYADYAQALGTTADALTETQKTQAFFNAVIASSRDLLEESGAAAETAADKFDKHAAAVDNLNLALGNFFREGSANSTTFWTKMIDGLTAYINAFNQYMNLPDKWDMSSGISTGPTPQQVGRYERNQALGVGRASQQADSLYTPDRLDALRDYYDSVQALEQDAAASRINTVEQYERQRGNVIRNYAQSSVREAQDFARQRVRAEAELQDEIAEVYADAQRRQVDRAAELARAVSDARAESADRLAELEADRSARIAELREDAQRRLVDLEADYARDREQAQRDHNERLLDAAGRLDARAIAEEQRRYVREREEAAAAHQEQVQDTRTQLDEQLAAENAAFENRRAAEERALDKRVAQAEAAYAEETDAAKRAANERVVTLQAETAARQAIEDEDRGIRLARQAADHAAQLTELDRAHAERLGDLQRSLADEKRELADAFAQRLEDLGLHSDNWLKEQKRLQDESIKLFDAYWAELNRRFDPSKIPNPAGGPTEQPERDPGMVLDGVPAKIDQTNVYLSDILRELRGEDTVRASSFLTGGVPIVPPPLGLNVPSVTAQSVTLNIAEGAFPIYAQPGMDGEDIGRVIVHHMTEALRRL
jgi:hypothetical protein